MLDECKEVLPETFVIPDYNVSISQETIGFTVPKVNGRTLSTILSTYSSDISEQISCLKQIGAILRQLENIRKYSGLNSIYINDINESNFVLDENGVLRVIDLDSVKIENNKVFPARYLPRNGLHSSLPAKYIRNEPAWNEVMSEYEARSKLAEGFYVPNNNTELYCYTIIILNYLYGDNMTKLSLGEFYNYLTYLKYIGVSQELIDCFANLVNNPDNYNPEELLDSLTSENVCRAKQYVYKQVQKNI